MVRRNKNPPGVHHQSAYRGITCPECGGPTREVETTVAGSAQVKGAYHKCVDCGHRLMGGE